MEYEEDNNRINIRVNITSSKRYRSPKEEIFFRHTSTTSMLTTLSSLTEVNKRVKIPFNKKVTAT